MKKLAKVLVICGPTATGKTSLGLKLAHEFNGEIISADSRQVYKNLDIGTGKNIQADYQRIKTSIAGLKLSYYQVDKTKIWGYDLATLNQEFSVGHYTQLIMPVITDIKRRNKLPILVGGTGFYIKSLLNPPSTLLIKPNLQLRAELESYSLEQLQLKLESIDSPKLAAMNNSDRNNPRRLIRAIEVGLARDVIIPHKKKYDQLWIGLKAAKSHLKSLVSQNIQQRLETGFEEEVVELLKQDLNWQAPWATATGYQIWTEYINGRINRPQAINLWSTQEHQYQKRQLTYFAKIKNIEWFDIKQPDYPRQVTDKVITWLKS